MADLNALIAQGTQFQAPVNPFVQYGQMQQLQQGEQANQLNQMKMQEMQRGMEETNAMSRLDPNSPTYLADITRINPEKGFAMGKMRQEAKTAGTEGQIKDTKLLADKLALLPEAYRLADDPEKYLALHQSVHADPIVGPYLKSLGATPEKGMATLQNAVQTGKFNELRMGSMQSVNQILESMKPLTVAASSSVYNPQTGTFTQAPATPVKNIANVNPGDFTPASMQKFNASGNYADLVPKPVDRVAKDDPKTTVAFREVDNAGNVTFYNKFGDSISTQKGAGKPSATFEKTTAQRGQLAKDLTAAITELTEITKDGGLIDQSTGSGAGRLIDLAAGFGGKAMPGAIAAAKLAPIADLALKMIPRFEGPQSNADTISYKQAAGQLADSSLPNEIKKEAGKTVLRLMKSRKDQFVTPSMADEGVAPTAAPATGGSNIDALLNKYK
jgi:hypothetical protein